MRAKELKEILSRVNDDWEIFVSPMILMKLFGEVESLDGFEPSPNPNERYKVVTVSEIANYGTSGRYNSQLVLGYDDSEVYTLDDDGTEKFPDKFIS